MHGIIAGFLIVCVTMGHAANLTDNPSFEKFDAVEITGWRWEGGSAHATYTTDSTAARSGKVALCIKNPSPQGPNIFGSLTQTIRVSPNRRYTLSCYVKTDKGGIAWIGGGRNWEHRFRLPEKTEGWQRVVGSFTTTAGENQFTLRINTDSATPGLWIDDVMLEEGIHATPFVFEAPLEKGESRLILSAFDPGENLIPNASFETITNQVPTDWRWDPRNTDATLICDTDNPHSGKTAIKITNNTAFGAHVYATLWLARAVPVKPSTSYTISAFIRTGEKTPGAWIGGGKDWFVRRALPATHGHWQRISHTFVTGDDETTFELRLCSDRPSEGFWLDDLSLREGERPVPSALEGAQTKDFIDLLPEEPPHVMHNGHAITTRWAPQRWPIETWAFFGNEFKAEGTLTLAEATRPTRVEIALSDTQGQILTRQYADVAPGSRAAFLTLRTELGGRTPAQLLLTARLLREQQQLAIYTNTVNLVSADRVRSHLAPLQLMREKLRTAVAQLEQQGLGAASRITLTTLDQFSSWIEADLANDKVDRAWDTVCMLEKMATRETAHAEAVLAQQAIDLPVPRYVTSKRTLSHAQTLGTRRFPNGKTERAPIFFTGYGHFSQVKRDIEKFPGYGCNIIQVEFGPSAVLPKEDATSDRAIDEFLSVCDRAAATNIAVNLLLSPHYFPQWALEKWPHLKMCHGGFFHYCVHDPAARAILEKSLRHVIPRIKDHPALHSVCISNEPVSEDLSQCPTAAKLWRAWLEKKHGSLATLNDRWGTTYADFAAIPIPKPAFTETPACLDFIRFNCETFADFHRWMAAVVHEVAPDLPVHAKIMMGAHFQKTLHGFWSVDPQAFATLSQYNGNDAYAMYDKEGSIWANGWRHCQAGYDFQRSMADLPIFNSENHIIMDRDLDVIPPEHIFSVLWQNAIHGQSSTTIWLWERCNDFISDASGSILHRPDCVEAVGRCGLTLNRLAHEVAAIQNLAPTITLLWSPSSVVLGHDHEHVLGDVYEAANFLGQPLGFVTEEKLAAVTQNSALPHPLETTRVLILPQVTHLPDATRAGIEKLAASGVRIVVVGDSPTQNEYRKPCTLKATENLPCTRDSATLFPELLKHASTWDLPPVAGLTLATGAPAFGVEVRTATLGNDRIVAICNHLREPQTVTLTPAPQGVATDLISGQILQQAFTVHPMKPVMIRIPGNSATP